MKSVRCFPIGLNYFFIEITRNASPILAQGYNRMIKLYELFIGMLDHRRWKYVTLLENCKISLYWVLNN